MKLFKKKMKKYFNDNKIPNKNLTFYSTNANFGSYIEAINNKNGNKNNQINVEDNKEKNNENNIDNEDNNININMPKRKTIYDDLNLRLNKKA